MAEDGARGAHKNLQHAVEAGVAGRRCREGEAGAVRREAASGGGAVAWGGGGTATTNMEGKR